MAKEPPARPPLLLWHKGAGMKAQVRRGVHWGMGRQLPVRGSDQGGRERRQGAGVSRGWVARTARKNAAAALGSLGFGMVGQGPRFREGCGYTCRPLGLAGTGPGWLLVSGVSGDCWMGPSSQVDDKRALPKARPARRGAAARAAHDVQEPAGSRGVSMEQRISAQRSSAAAGLSRAAVAQGKPAAGATLCNGSQQPAPRTQLPS